MLFRSDLPIEAGMARAKARGQLDRFEQEQTDFFNRIRNTYLMRAEQEPERFVIINADQPLAQVQADLQQLFPRILEQLGG